MLLKVSGVSRLVDDVELRYSNDGKAIATLRLANSEKYKEKEDKCFIKATIFGRGAEIVNQYCQKGSQIFITGKQKQNVWTGQDGKKNYEHYIVVEEFELLGGKKDNEQISAPTQKKSQVEDSDFDPDSVPF